MIELFEPVALIWLVIFVLFELVAAIGAARMPLGMLGLPLARAGELREGRFRLDGELRALGAMPTTLDGTPCIAVETRIAGNSMLRSEKIWAETVVVDPSGQCAVDLDGVVLIGEAMSRSVSADQLRMSAPGLWAQLNERQRAASMHSVEQRFVRAGPGFVAGEVSPGLRRTAEGYRAAPRAGLAIASGLGAPLIVASLPRSAVARHLLGPAVLHLAAALLALALACVAFSFDRWITAVSGLH